MFSINWEKFKQQAESGTLTVHKDDFNAVLGEVNAYDLTDDSFKVILPKGEIGSAVVFLNVKPKEAFPEYDNDGIKTGSRIPFLTLESKKQRFFSEYDVSLDIDNHHKPMTTLIYVTDEIGWIIQE